MMKPWRWIFFVGAVAAFCVYAYRELVELDTLSLIVGFSVGTLFVACIAYIIVWLLIDYRTKQLHVQYNERYVKILERNAKERRQPVVLASNERKAPEQLPPPPPRLLAARKIDGDPDTPGNFRVIGEEGSNW